MYTGPSVVQYRVIYKYNMYIIIIRVVKCKILWQHSTLAIYRCRTENYQDVIWHIMFLDTIKFSRTQLLTIKNDRD